MQGIYSYLTFNGNCREAMSFYQKCMGAELHTMPFSEMPGDFPAEAKDRVMHARLTKGPAIIMASDTMPGMPFHPGNNFSISVACESMEEIKSLFNAFSEKANVTMPLQDTFWGAHFGMLTDQFGTQWMFNFDKPQQK